MHCVQVILSSCDVDPCTLPKLNPVFPVTSASPLSLLTFISFLELWVLTPARLPQRAPVLPELWRLVIWVPYPFSPWAWGCLPSASGRVFLCFLVSGTWHSPGPAEGPLWMCGEWINTCLRPEFFYIPKEEMLTDVKMCRATHENICTSVQLINLVWACQFLFYNKRSITCNVASWRCYKCLCLVLVSCWAEQHVLVHVLTCFKIPHICSINFYYLFLNLCFDA